MKRKYNGKYLIIDILFFNIIDFIIKIKYEKI